MYDLVIIPTYNERENIKLLINEISQAYPDLRILVVDDSSPDGTAEEVRKIKQKNNQVDLLVRPEKNGLGAAYITALQRVRQDENLRYIFTMDADGSHDHKYLQAIMTALKDHDLVVGSRYVKGGDVEDWELWRKLLSRGGNIYSRILTRSGITDLTAGFMGIRRELLAKIDFSHFHTAGYAYQIEFKCYCKYNLKARIGEVPIIFKSRRGGESKLSQQIISEGVLTPWRILWKRNKI